MLGGISICLRKCDPSTCMIIHIPFLQMFQLYWRSVLICLVNVTLTTKTTLYTLQAAPQSVLICLVNVTLTAKSTLHTSQFASSTVAIYYNAVGLEKIYQTEKHTEKHAENKQRFQLLTPP